MRNGAVANQTHFSHKALQLSGDMISTSSLRKWNTAVLIDLAGRTKQHRHAHHLTKAKSPFDPYQHRAVTDTFPVRAATHIGHEDSPSPDTYKKVFHELTQRDIIEIDRCARITAASG